MEASIEGAARSFKKVSRLAFSWLKDTSNFALEHETKVGKNKENNRTTRRISRAMSLRSSVSRLTKNFTRIS